MKNNNSTIIISIVVIALIGVGIVISQSGQNKSESSTKTTTSNQSTTTASNNPSTPSTTTPSNTSTQSTATPASTTTSQTTSNATQKTGVYTQYSKELVAKAENQPTVLFFHANWCPTCKAMEKDLNEKADQLKTSGVQVLKIDYDTANDLKKQYGVTGQSTFVKVDKDGNKIKTTQGITKLDDLSSFATSN